MALDINTLHSMLESVFYSNDTNITAGGSSGTPLTVTDEPDHKTSSHLTLTDSANSVKITNHTKIDLLEAEGGDGVSTATSVSHISIVDDDNTLLYYAPLNTPQSVPLDGYLLVQVYSSGVSGIEITFTAVST